MSYSNATTAVLPPPTERYSALGWLRKNLFGAWYDALFTLVAFYLVFTLGRGLLIWVFTQARWAVITTNLRLFMVGQYPAAHIWRVWLCVAILAFIIGVTWGIWVYGRRIPGLLLLALPVAFMLLPSALVNRMALAAVGGAGLLGFGLGRLSPRLTRRAVPFIWAIYFPLVILLISGFGGDKSVLPPVPTNLWGGLLLTFLLTVVGIVFSFPMGVLLALGRRSQLPIISALSVAFIELVRGVPFVSIIFMSQLMLPLFLPEGMTIDRVIRAMAGVTIFSAAYLAENVRGGLQSIPQGQVEAAHALGLSGFKTMLLIVLPQALRAVIPVLVGQFISLFKDTSLVVIVGLLELLGIAKAVLAQPDFLGLQTEVYLFISVLYGIFCYLMSAVSQRLETALGVGVR